MPSEKGDIREDRIDFPSDSHVRQKHKFLKVRGCDGIYEDEVTITHLYEEVRIASYIKCHSIGQTTLTQLLKLIILHVEATYSNMGTRYDLQT